jgi:hypothetical protein
LGIETNVGCALDSNPMSAPNPPAYFPRFRESYSV